MTEEKKNEIDILKEEIALAKKQAEEHLAGWKRAKADYLNLKKDAEKRHLELIQFSNAALLAGLLPIFDHFKLALKHVPEEQKDLDWVVGLGHVKKEFQDFFKDLGIEEIKTVGEKFNPEFHEAVTHEEKEGLETDFIFEEVKSGYTLHGKVINPAQVKVAK
jgi:molecular chaperone GrpE